MRVQIPRCPVSRPGVVLDGFDVITNNITVIIIIIIVIIIINTNIIIVIIIDSQNPVRSWAWRCRWVECPSLCLHFSSSPPCAPLSRKGRAWSTRRPTSEPRCRTSVAAWGRTMFKNQWNVTLNQNKGKSCHCCKKLKVLEGIVIRCNNNNNNNNHWSTLSIYNWIN